MLADTLAFAVTVALSAAAFAVAVWAAVKADDALRAAKQANSRADARSAEAHLLRTLYLGGHKKQ